MPAFSTQAQIAGESIPGALGVQQQTSLLMQRFALRTAETPARQRLRLVNPENGNRLQNPDALDLSRTTGSATRSVTATESKVMQIHTTANSFDAATFADTNSFPPDSMGTVGPNQFIAFVNGRLRSYTKTGVADGVLNVTPETFFASVMTPVVNPVTLNFATDPQIRFDRFTGRWFLSIIDVPCTDQSCSTLHINRWLLAVSDAASNGTITGSTVWTFFYFQGDPTNFLDYPSLGIDVNALYVGGPMFTSAGAYGGTNGYVIQKSSVLGAGPIVVTKFANLATSAGAGPAPPRGVDNFDAGAIYGYFIGTDNASFSTLTFRRVTNPGTSSPTISANISLTVPTTTTSNPVEHLGNTGGNNGRLDSVDDRLFAAMIRNGRLWTAHNFRVDASGVASTTTESRNAMRWYEIQTLDTTPTLTQSGTVFDSAATRAAARQYFIGSVAVTGQGHAVMGMTMAGSPVGATPVYVGRLAGDTAGTMNGPPTVAAISIGTSTANYNPIGDPGGTSGRRWGDYSFTSVDPLDDMTVWTAQEYNQATNRYAVRVAKLAAPPPATPNCAATPINFTGPTGNVVITATSSGGSGFYDPGANLPAPARPFNHLSATVSNATVNSVIYNSPTQATLNITASASGSQNLTMTNPDGQSVSVNGCIIVTPAPTLTSITPSTGSTAGGYNVTISGSNLRSATGVTIGGSACAPLSANTDTSVTCTTPSGTAGTSSVVVTTASGSNSANTLYTYVVPAPAVSLTPTSLVFGDQHLGTTSPTQSVVLTNTGSAALTGIGISPTLSEFGMVNGCGSSLLAGASCSLSVSFTPNSAGTRVGALTLSSNATSNPGVVLTGYGVASNVPICTLIATPSKVKKNGTSTLTPSCSPAATSFVWTGGTCQGTTGSTCTVTPAVTTTYGVTGTNSFGSSSPAATTVTVNSEDLTPILMLLLD
jgi:hypothetical protein